MECGVSDIFRAILVLARKNVQKTTFEAAEMMLGPWNQQNTAILVKEKLSVIFSAVEAVR